MRYAKGGLVINPERDIPLLRQVRNSRFVSHNQLFELMKFGGSDRSRDSFNWRVRRLLKSAHISICGGIFCAGRCGKGNHPLRSVTWVNPWKKSGLAQRHRVLVGCAAASMRYHDEIRVFSRLMAKSVVGNNQ